MTFDSPRAASTLVALALGLALTLGGVIVHQSWQVLPAERFALALVLMLLAWLAALVLSRLLRWSVATTLALVWGVALGWFVGIPGLLAVALIGAAALAIGQMLAPRGHSDGLALHTLLGLVVLAAIAGWTTTWPVHRAWVWLPILLMVVAARRHPLHASLKDAARNWRDAVAAAPHWAVMAISLIGMASTACWLPTMQQDDLTYHLNLPAQWLAHGRYAPDPGNQVWAFAPWAGDHLQAITALLSRQLQHGSMNALWLLLGMASAWSLLHTLRASIPERWMLLALLASFPPWVWMAAGMQTELPAVALTLALATLVVARSPGSFWAGLLLFAGLLSLKLTHAWAALPLLALAGWQQRNTLPWRKLLLAVPVLLLVAGSSYLQSAWHTGNPVLPLANAWFRSPFHPPVDFVDTRWHAGLEPLLPWHMTFQTSRYVEGWDGALGLALLALSGVWLLKLSRGPQRALLLAASVMVLLPLLPMQYARYAYPSLLLCLLLVPIGLRGQLGAQRASIVLIVLCVLNLAFQANAGWTHHSAALKRLISGAGQYSSVLPHYTPERMLARQIPTTPRDIVLLADTAHDNAGEFAGRGRTVSHHNPRLHAAAAAAENDAQGTQWLALLHAEQISWVIAREPASPALHAALQRVEAEPHATSGVLRLWRLPASDASER